MKILTSTAQYHETVSELRTKFLNNDLGDSLPDIRWKIGKCLRTLSKDCDWRHSVLQAILIQIMEGGNAAEGERNLPIFIPSSKFLTNCSLP